MAERPPVESPVQGIINYYSNRFGELMGHELPPTIRRVKAFDERGNRSVGYRLVLRPEREWLRRPGGRELLLDYDETQAPTSQTKENFWKALTELLPTPGHAGPFMQACEVINRVARAHPQNGNGKERYAPVLELRGIGRLLNTIHGRPRAEIPTDEAKIRELINMEVYTETPEVPGPTRWPTLPVTRRPNRYIEGEEYALHVDYGDKAPYGVNQDVWNRFKQHMANGNIQDNELQNFNAYDDVWSTTFTFGPLDHQLEKTFKAVEKLKLAGARIPDEIFVITDGRKYPFVQQKMREIPGLRMAYVDDGLEHLVPLIGTPGLTLVHADRPGTKEAGATVPDGVLQVKVAERTHREILDLAA